jgi:hypothetical protein
MDMQHGHGHAVGTWTCITDMDMQHGHEHAARTWTCGTDMDMRHDFGHAAWIWTMDMHGCQNADKKLSPASLVFH